MIGHTSSIRTRSGPSDSVPHESPVYPTIQRSRLAAGRPAPVSAINPPAQPPTHHTTGSLPPVGSSPPASLREPSGRRRAGHPGQQRHGHVQHQARRHARRHRVHRRADGPPTHVRVLLLGRREGQVVRSHLGRVPTLPARAVAGHGDADRDGGSVVAAVHPRHAGTPAGAVHGTAQPLRLVGTEHEQVVIAAPQQRGDVRLALQPAPLAGDLDVRVERAQPRDGGVHLRAAEVLLA